jgi:hypothetical protein
MHPWARKFGGPWLGSRSDVAETFARRSFCFMARLIAISGPAVWRCSQRSAAPTMSFHFPIKQSETVNCRLFVGSEAAYPRFHLPRIMIDPNPGSGGPVMSGSGEKRLSRTNGRSGKERRSGIDTRTEEEKRIVGERRSTIDRRSGSDRRLNVRKPS